MYLHNDNSTNPGINGRKAVFFSENVHVRYRRFLAGHEGSLEKYSGR